MRTSLSPEKLNLIESSFNRSETLKFYHAKLIDAQKGYISILIPKQSLMTRKHGMFNGSMIASLVDVSSGYAAVSNYEDDCYVVTVELKVNYLNPALGDNLLSKAYTVKSGKKINVIRTEIYTVDHDLTNEKHVATSLVTMMRIK